MKRLLIVTLFGVVTLFGTFGMLEFFSPTPVEAQQTPYSRPQPVTREVLTISTTGVGLSANTLDPTDNKGRVTKCVGVVEGQPIRTRTVPATPNGAAVAPTSTEGTLYTAGQWVVVEGYHVLITWRAIRSSTASADATLYMECFREYRP
jgi:hypothetical protein